jgi:FlaA1/EpsC-like NDP-sugar epimerase
MRRLLGAHGTGILVVLDGVLVVASLALALLFRYNGQLPSGAWPSFRWFAMVAVVVFVAVLATNGMYSRMWRFASVIEARQLLRAGTIAGILLGGLDLVGGTVADRRPVPLSVAVAGSAFATGLMGCSRFQSRLVASRRRTSQSVGLRVVVIGAGDTGASLVRQMLTSPRAGLVPVALLDDNPATHGRSCLGVRVLGPTRTLGRTVTELTAHQVVLAVPSAPLDLVRQVAADAEAVGVALKVVPDYDDLVRNGLRLQDVRELRIEDLLGRAQVETDLAAVHALIEGRRVLVTGAGGSIGSEIARQVATCAPATLVLLDHDETHLHDLATTMAFPVVLDLADVRDASRISRALATHRPDIVFHAAAHKHVPILEDYPDEAVRTNVLGTDNVLQAARQVGVSRFVMISTDKAVQPSSVMGASKRVAEFLTVRAAEETQLAYCAVRFGNVLGSRGSVIPTFMRQIEAGGPVTVTDARMTRYFMSIPEAVQLVLQAATMSSGGEVFMLDMGEPMRIIDLAKRMIRLSGRRVGVDVEVRVTGTRPGEKFEERLRSDDEHPEATGHPSVIRLSPVVPDRETLLDVVATMNGLSEREERQAIKHQLVQFARTGQGPPETFPPRQRVIDLDSGAATWTPSTT